MLTTGDGSVGAGTCDTRDSYGSDIRVTCKVSGIKKTLCRFRVPVSIRGAFICVFQSFGIRFLNRTGRICFRLIAAFRVFAHLSPSMSSAVYMIEIRSSTRDSPSPDVQRCAF